jgi:hypothetical protein
LISNDGQDYICITTHTSTSTFDATKFSADVADLTVADVKNIKTYYKETMVQQPIPGIVTGVV